jgi:hypothetical protein
MAQWIAHQITDLGVGSSNLPEGTQHVLEGSAVAANGLENRAGLTAESSILLPSAMLR